MDNRTIFRFEFGDEILELITLLPIEDEVYVGIAEIVSRYFKNENLAQMTDHAIENKLAEIYEEVRKNYDVELFYPAFEKEQIAAIEKLLDEN